MKNSIKLFPGTIIGLILGILVAVPLLYTTVVVAPITSSSSSGLCDVEIVYAYLERQNTTVVTVGYDEDTGRSITEELDEPNVRAIAVINVTRNFAIVTPSIAELWVYQVEFYTDKGSISNVTYYMGVLSEEPPALNSLDDLHSSPFQITMNQLMNYSSYIPEIYSGENGGGGVYTYWPIGNPVTQFLPAGDNDWVSAVDTSETIFVRVKELGWIVYGDSTEVVVLPEPNVLADVQLDIYNYGYLHNIGMSNEHLAEIELLDPAPWDFYE
ncbi:MAG: hypothetical protein NWF06_05490 [Candidatus Bathyarchaeota archaeon]|nr:hypothetical protein [Candidatus Bathyarchaeum sp.]